MKRVEKDDPSTLSFIKVKWIDGMRFVATDSMGHSIVMDASKQSGGEGSGFSPLQLLLIALGGYTGMDIVHITRKQRQQVDGLEILVSGR
ncbi:MAG: OsmC family protein [Candidatus Bathyarchaeota archaeon]|nr:OsmC family protein [Candidatus Bathyarchaeota archaeon]